MLTGTKSHQQQLECGRAAGLSHRQTMPAGHRAPTKKHSISLNKPSTDLVAQASVEMQGFSQWKECWQLKPNLSRRPQSSHKP